MSLGDHWSEYLEPGWHSVTVKSFREFKFNSGTAGVEFVVGDRAGKTAKMDGFNLLPQCQYKLAQFASACGMSRKDASAYNPEQPNSHSIMVGKGLRVRVAKVGDYNEVVEYAPEDGSAMPEASSTPEPPPPPPNETTTQGADPASGDDIPF